MKLIQAKPSRLHCSNCDDTYSLPQNGGIKLYQELKCPLDDYELVLWTTGTKGKVFINLFSCFSILLMPSGFTIAIFTHSNQQMFGTALLKFYHKNDFVIYLNFP